MTPSPLTRNLLSVTSHRLLVIGIAFVCAQTIGAGEPAKDKYPGVRLGSRAAVNVLMNGDIPRRWLQRAGADMPPKTLVWPIAGRGMGRGYGSDDGRHLAVDITAPEGTPVRVAARGLVGYANNTVKGYGRMMLVLHPGGWVTLYAHLSKYKARAGEWVTRGQVIASTGNTGISRGPHLHFALLIKGTPVDPEPLFQEIPKRRRNVKISRRGK